MKKRVAGAIVLGVIVLGGVATVLLWPKPSAAAAAHDYLHALEAGDLERITELGVDVSDEAAAAFAAASEYISDPTVTDVSDDGHTGTATVSYTLDGETHSTVVEVANSAGAWSIGAGPIKPAAPATGLGMLSLTTTLGADAKIGSGVFATPGEYALLPAVYEPRAGLDGILSGRTSVAVLLGEETSAEVPVALADDAASYVQTELDDYLAACTVTAATVPAGCGIIAAWGADFATVTEIRYSTEAEPAVQLTESTFVASDGILTATVTGTGLDGQPKTATYRTSDWTVRGSVTFTADGLALAVW